MLVETNQQFWVIKLPPAPVLLSLPVFMENSVCWLGLVPQGFLVDCIGLIVHAFLFKLLCPGHIKSSSSGADAFTEDVTIQHDGVRVITRL